MNTLEFLRRNREEILAIARRHGVHRIRVFGSVARNEDAGTSDIDFLVEIGPDPSPWFPAGLVLDLESLLGRPVEIVTEGGLNPLLKERILREAVHL